MIPANRTTADTARAAGLLGISPGTFTNTRRWEKLRAQPISRPGAKTRFWDDEQLIAAVDERRTPLITPANPDEVFNLAVEDASVLELLRDFLAGYFTGTSSSAPVADGARIAPAADTAFDRVEVFSVYAADEMPEAAEDAVVDVNVKLAGHNEKGSWPLNAQLRLEFTGGRWVVAALAREDEDDLFDLEEAYLLIPEDRRPTISTWRTYATSTNRKSARLTSIPEADKVVHGVKHWKRSTITNWDQNDRFLQGEAKAGGRPAGSADRAPRRRTQPLLAQADERRAKLRELLAENPALTPAEAGAALGVSAERGRQLLHEAKAGSDK
ncbi:hypothetical protein [Kitasatospora sp. NBC_01300]|uniref:hypothetical protein n=1 Tax=Kitasatospora sp. NBC_01300 TaxID=2903574 RepID=UPI00352ED6C2|nr:hypothetical protein OG556_40785 [Kitasatospora sp. NBC_01300]